MMRTVFWILLAGNVILFAVMQWGGSLSGESASQAQPALHEEKLRLLEGAQVAVPQSAPAVASPVPAVSSVPVAIPAVLPASKPEARACLEWGEFSGADLTRAKTALAALHLGERLGRREVEYHNGYWVYIPPLKDKAGIAQKLAQLKARGVEEYFVVQEAGPWLNAISLGVFKTREAAQNFANELPAKDVNSAQVGERSSKLKATVFVLNGLDAAMSGKLKALHKDFPGSEQKEVSCAH